MDDSGKPLIRSAIPLTALNMGQLRQLIALEVHKQICVQFGLTWEQADLFESIVRQIPQADTAYVNWSFTLLEYSLANGSTWEEIIGKLTATPEG